MSATGIALISVWIMGGAMCCMWAKDDGQKFHWAGLLLLMILWPPAFVIGFLLGIHKGLRSIYRAWKEAKP